MDAVTRLIWSVSVRLSCDLLKLPVLANGRPSPPTQSLSICPLSIRSQQDLFASSCEVQRRPRVGPTALRLVCKRQSPRSAGSERRSELCHS